MNSTTSRRRFVAAAAGIGAALALPHARAQSYPAKPIRLIVGFPPGGGADAFARLLAPYLSEKLGQPIAVENRTGANGAVATEFVSKAPADGYTLLLSTSSATVAAPHAQPNLAVHPVKGLAHISLATESEFILITNPGLEAKTFGDFVALAKRTPRKVIHASPGNGSANHVAGELLSMRTGIVMNTVHYRGSGPIMTDLLANQVHLTIASVGLAESYIKSGKVGSLMVMGRQRLSQLPDIPTSAELGVADLDKITFWLSLHAPRSTPAAVINRVQQALTECYKVDALRERMLSTGMKPVANTPAAFATRLDSELALYGEIFRTAGIKVE